MADNKVTIDAAWFAELYEIYSKFKNIENYGVGLAEKCDKYRIECERIAKERDELKAKLEESQKHYCTSATGKIGYACALARRCTELDDAIVKEQDKKIKVIKELNEVRELNRKCRDENEELKAQLEQERMNKCDEVTVQRLAAAERCIDQISVCNFNINTRKTINGAIHDIIRAYREKEEEK